MQGAYPRWRGETRQRKSSPRPSSGLSPLARGNRPERAFGGALAGPIPAGAGKPAPLLAWPLADRAYPRWRGETALRSAILPRSSGLSPLARGNRRQRFVHAFQRGPIPAGAGKPSSRVRRASRVRAYPRWRGETLSRKASAPAPWGLSPLARGNLRRPRGLRCRPGPIPAGAGKPISPLVNGLCRWAYPRWRGETQRFCCLLCA